MFGNLTCEIEKFLETHIRKLGVMCMCVYCTRSAAATICVAAQFPSGLDNYGATLSTVEVAYFELRGSLTKTVGMPILF